MQTYFVNYIKAVEHPLPQMQEYFDKENEYLKVLVSSESSVLDVGCGNGRTMKFLAPYVKEILGIDYDPKMIAAANGVLASVNNSQLIEADFLQYAFNRDFDLVYGSYNLLGSSETADRQLVLNRMLDMASSGGHVVNSVWSDEGVEFARQYYPSIGISVQAISGTDVITDQGTFKRFTRGELEALGAQSGLPFSVGRFNNIFYFLDITKRSTSSSNT